MVIGPLVTEPFMSIWIPKMFEISKRPDAPGIYANMLTYFLLLITFLGLGISVLIKDVLTFMSAPEFHSAYQVVPIIVCSYILWGASYHVRIGILLAKQTKHIAYIMGAGAVFNVLLNLVLIPRYGMWGAAWSNLSAYALVLLLTYVISSRFLRIHYQFGRILLMLAAAALVYASSLYINVSPIALRVGLKVALVMAFPAVLLLVGFYRQEEIAHLKEIWSQGLRAAQRLMT
jgi:O-antigen/teichoic acid export membrane protein